MAGEFLLHETVGLIRRVSEMQRMLQAFWQHPKAHVATDPETSQAMHALITKISALFGIRGRSS